MQNVIINGGLGALGQAAAAAFRDRGDAVLTIGLETNSRKDHIGGIDLADAAAAAQAFARAEGHLGALDVLVNAAGAFAFAPLDKEPDAWDAMFSANLRTCVNMCRVAAPRLRSAGAIVNVGAAAAGHAGAGMGPYAASKAAVARLTESLAEELAGRTRVNAVLPRVLDTPQNRAAMPDADWRTWTPPAAVAALDGWVAEPSGEAICRRLVFGDFSAAFRAMTGIALAAERLDHHPEWSNVYRELDIRLTTHDVGGVSQRDIVLAREIDMICKDA